MAFLLLHNYTDFIDLETELFKDTLLEDSNLSDYIKNQLPTIWRD
ncbi:hypothetical protein P7765_03550 [Staphylococcus aureus]|nr:hypothetical protein [Staphylococcus aureus]MDM6519897.1 hypothetical protein [Staphylococcus aureus]MDM6697529.1 hypothetical protein [Staphylococcus aureus]